MAKETVQHALDALMQAKANREKSEESFRKDDSLVDLYIRRAAALLEEYGLPVNI